MSLYKDLILAHYRNPKNYGRLRSLTKRVVLENPLCGDKIIIEVLIKKGKIQAVAFRGEGCIISRASASMVTEYIKGKSEKSLQKLDKDFIIKMLGISLGPVRLKCALLPLRAVKRLISLKK